MEWPEFQRHLSMFPPEKVVLIHQAYDMGAQAHGTQQRKSGEPYFYHPVAVAAMLAEMGADADTVIAALLHDTLEDTDLAEEEIKHAFGSNALELVRGVTKLSQEDFRDQTTINEQVETLRKMFTVMQKDVRIMVIKLVDRLHNMKTIGALPAERQQALANETQDVYVKIADRLCMQGIRDQLAGMCLSVLRPEMHEKLSELRKDSELLGAKVHDTVLGALRDHPAMHSVHIQPEAKSWKSLMKQSEMQGAAMGISDATLVFVCPDEDTCYRVLGALHGHWKRETLSFQDFISSPQVNGYKGLHTTIFLENGIRIRCKIRTAAMNEYDRKGIVTMCFDNTSKGLTDYFAWAKDISQLSEDTRGRSGQFWESLQYDILGEAIVVHGPADEVVHLPIGATAMDAAFYLFREKALRITHIHLNGQDTRPGTPVTQGDVVTIILGPELAVRREWLNTVKTGLATAMIRTSLSATQSPDEKLLLGRALLQKVLEDHRQGYIEEFRAENIQSALTRLGFASLSEAYIALADGRMNARELYAALFEQHIADRQSERHKRRNIHYTVDMNDTQQMERLGTVHHAFRSTIEEIRYRSSGMITTRVRMNTELLERFTRQLSTTGAMNIEVSPFATRMGIAWVSLLLVILWGLDPAIAKFLLVKLQVSPLDMTIVRFMTLAVMSGALLLRKHMQSLLRPARLPLSKSSLWISAMLFFIIGISTYGSLQLTTPLVYTIPMTSAGMLITSISERRNRMKILTAWLICLLGFGILVVYTPNWSLEGIGLTLLAVISFSSYWAISERYKRMERVSFRSVEFFFILSAICALVSLLLLPMSGLLYSDLSTLLALIVFSIVFVGTPYYLLYNSSHLAVSVSSRYSFVTILLTGVMQLLLFGTLNVSALMAGSLILVGAALLSIDRPRITRH